MNDIAQLLTTLSFIVIASYAAGYFIGKIFIDKD